MHAPANQTSRPVTREPGVLAIGTDASSPGLFHFGDPASPGFSGFDVELCRAIAARLGLTPRFEDCLWSAMVEELQCGTFDAVCTAATVTEARRAVVDFSVPYFDVVVAVVVRDGGSVARVADLPGKRLGVRVSTTAEDALRAFLPAGRMQTYHHNVDAYADLRVGNTDAVADDLPIARYFVEQQPGLKIVGALPGSASQYAIMFAKGNDALRAQVDRVLTQLRSEGFLAQLRKKWFGAES